MVRNAPSLNADERRALSSFIGKLGLPSTLLDLRISGLVDVLKSEKLSAKNKTLIFRFLGHISAEVSERRLTFYTHKLKRLGTWLKRDFDAVTEQDLRCLVTFFSKGCVREDGGAYKPGTLHGYKVTLKRFYRWLEGNDEEYPRKVKWIKSNGDTTRIHEPEQLLTCEEILEMIRHARNPRDKALISFLYDSGARIGETLSMKIKHLEFLADMLKATLPVSKTQPRVISLVSCRQHIVTWFNCHPLKDDPDAPLWSNLKGVGNKPLLEQTVSRILKTTAEAAGIKKRVYPHLFRACSITHKQAEGYPEQFIKMFHGLCKDSKVMKHYSHLSYSDLEAIQRKMNGLPVEDKPGLNSGIRCPSCGKKNPLYVEMCECGLPTETKIVHNGHMDMMAEIESRVENKINKFLESRRVHDEMMERFMTALLEKSKGSPVLLKAIGEIGIDMREKQAILQTPTECHN